MADTSKYRVYGEVPVDPASKYTVYGEPPQPLELEPSPMDRMLGREKTVPAVGSMRDNIERKRRDMPTQSEYNTGVEEAQIVDAVKGAGEFDPSSTFEDVNGYLSLFDVNRSNESTEQFRKFKSKYPKGDLLFIPTDSGTVPVARKSSEEPFRRLGNIGPAAATIASPQTAIAVGAGIVTGGLGWLPAMAVQGVAGAAGSVIDNAIEYFRGYQDTSVAGMAGEAALEGGLNMAIEPVARGITGSMGRGKEAVITSLKEIAEAGDEIPVLRGQTGNPIKTTVFKFVSRFSPQAKLALREQRATIRSLISEKTEFTPEMLASMSDQELANYLDLIGSDLILTKIGVTGMDKYATGKALTEAVQKYRMVGRAATDSLYEQAEAMGRGEMWDARPLQKFAQEKMVPVEGRAARVPDENGNLPMGDDVYGSVELSAPLNRELESIYKAITDLDQTIALHKDNTGLKQLMTLRTRAADLLLQDLPSEQNRQVAELYDALTKTIENPVTGNGAFVAKWREANDTYKAYMDFLRASQVKAALTNKPAEKVAEKFFQPNGLDFMRTLKTVLGGDPDTAPAWEALKIGFKEQFTTSTDKLATANRVLDKYSPQELSLLMSKEEQRTLRTASFQAQQIQNGSLSKMLREFNSDGARILDFVQNGRDVEIKQLVEKAGGLDSDTAAGLRAGVFQNLLNASEYIDENTGKILVDPGKLSRSLSELRKSGRLNSLFRPEDWRRFSNWEKVGAVVGRSADEGSSIQAGEIASDFAETPFTVLTQPGKTAGLLLKLGFMDTLGYVLSRPQSFEKVLQAGEAMDAKRRDRALVNATWQVMQDLTRTYSNREDLTPMQEAERAAGVMEQRPGVLEAFRSLLGAGQDYAPLLLPPETPAPVPTPPPAPTPGRQGALQPPQAPASMPPRSMAQAMPPQAPQKPEQGIAGTRYAALFPGDTLGAMAAQGGIASLRG